MREPIEKQLNFRHKFAYENLQFIRKHLDNPRAREVIQEWQLDIVLSILENGRLTETECRLSPKEFDKLSVIAIDFRKVGLR